MADLENLQERDEEAEILAQLEAEEAEIAKKKAEEEANLTSQNEEKTEVVSGTLDSLKQGTSPSSDEEVVAEDEEREEETSPVPAPIGTVGNLEEDTEKLIKKYYGSWTNESNLDLDDHLIITVLHKGRMANAQLTKMFSLREKLIELLNGSYSGMKFRNDERAKSVIALIVSLESIGNLNPIPASKKYRAIDIILSQHKSIDPRG